MIYRVFIADMGKFTDKKNYEFIAEFADQEFAQKYILWMRKKKRFEKKDIIIMEYDGEPANPSEGNVAGVITVLGEYLPVEEYDFK